MTKQARPVAVVGCGIGRAHIEEGYLPNADRFRVVAICDPDAARREAVASQFGIERRVAEFAQILAMDDVEVVDICTPPFLHFEQVGAALRSGKHVICEKPLVGSLHEVDALAELERSSGRRLMPIFQSRFGDGVQQIKRLIEMGLCGKPYVATAETCWQRGTAYYAAPWRGKWATELGGTLLAHGIHTHDILTYLMGPLQRLSAYVTTRVNPIETEDCVAVAGLLTSGAPVTITGTTGSHRQFTRLYLAFENLTIESETDPYEFYNRPWRIVPANSQIGAQVDGALSNWMPVAAGFATQFRLFHEALAFGGALPVSVADARRSLELATAIYLSSRSGKEVTLPIDRGSIGYDGWAP